MSTRTCHCGSGLIREPVYGLNGLLYGYNCPQCRAQEIVQPAEPPPENARPKKLMISTPLGRSFLTTARYYAFTPKQPEMKPNCGSCGYSLLGNISGVCPECGTPIPPMMITQLLELNRKLKMPIERKSLFLFKGVQPAPPANSPERKA